MNATSDGVPAGTTHGATERRLSRRTVMVGAAWSVPAIVAMTTTPAYAVSGVTRTVSVAATNMQVTASGSTQVKAQVKDNGSPAVGAAVSFSGPSGSSFAPASPTTDSSGTAQTNLTLGNTWAKPGSTVTVTAVSGSATASQGLTVTGANLLAAGSGYTSSFAQEALVFPSPIVQATASDFSGTYVLLQDGTVWSKGRNGSGQLGDGTTTDRTSTWAMIAGLSGVTQLVAGGQSAYALLSDGSVRAWGSNNQGQLGDGTTTDRYTPVSVMASSSVVLTGVTQIAGGYSSGHALMSDGSVKSWGANDHGQLGDGTGSLQRYPVTAMKGFDPSHPFASVRGPLQNATQIAAGRYTVYARISDGTVRAWGYNVNGQVGDGNSGNSADQGFAVPVRTTANTEPSGMTALQNVAAVTAGSFSGYAVLTDKTAVAWGRNAGGELGNGQIGGQEPRPVAVQNLTDISLLSGGREFCVAMQADGTVLTWGNNYSGQLGNGSTSARPLPGPVSSLQGQTVSALGVQPQAFATFLITAV